MSSSPGFTYENAPEIPSEITLKVSSTYGSDPSYIFEIKRFSVRVNKSVVEGGWNVMLSVDGWPSGVGVAHLKRYGSISVYGLSDIKQGVMEVIKCALLLGIVKLASDEPDKKEDDQSVDAIAVAIIS